MVYIDSDLSIKIKNQEYNLITDEDGSLIFKAGSLGAIKEIMAPFGFTKLWVLKSKSAEYTSQLVSLQVKEDKILSLKSGKLKIHDFGKSLSLFLSLLFR